MTIYIAGPDGKPIAFATDEETEAYRKERREAEASLLNPAQAPRRSPSLVRASP
jgi:hypothetical protein